MGLVTYKQRKTRTHGCAFLFPDAIKELIVSVLSLESFLEHRTRGGDSPPSVVLTGEGRHRLPPLGRGAKQTEGAKLTHRRKLATQGPSLPPFCSLTKTHVIKFVSFHCLECTEQRGTPGRGVVSTAASSRLTVAARSTLTSSAFCWPPRPLHGHIHRVMGDPAGRETSSKTLYIVPETLVLEQLAITLMVSKCPPARRQRPGPPAARRLDTVV